MFNSFMYSDLAWPDIKVAIEEGYIVILPVGSTEQHGPHLPLCTDDYMAQKWAYDAARLAREKWGTKVLVLPGIHFGNAEHHMGFPGTISLSFEVLKKLVFEVADSVLRHGFRKLVILNVHGGNRFAVRAAAIELKAKYAKNRQRVIIRVAEDCDPDLNPLVKAREQLKEHTREAEENTMVHGGMLETAKMLYLKGQLVAMDRARDVDIPLKKGPEVVFFDEITPLGAQGRPYDASAEVGRIMWKVLTTSLADYLHRLYQEKL